jgi:hypothetical protein
VAKEIDRLKAAQGSENLEDLTPDKDMYDVIHSTSRPVPDDLKPHAQEVGSPSGTRVED